jgi:hypothetical protein
MTAATAQRTVDGFTAVEHQIIHDALAEAGKSYLTPAEWEYERD